MDFEKPKVYGDTSITDGLVSNKCGLVEISLESMYVILDKQQNFMMVIYMIVFCSILIKRNKTQLRVNLNVLSRLSLN